MSSIIRAEALKDVGKAINAYTKAQRKAKRTGEGCDINKYKPSFKKKKGKGTDSFRYAYKNKDCPPFRVKSAHHFTLTHAKRL